MHVVYPCRTHGRRSRAEKVEIRENQDYDSEKEMTSETEETDDDESEQIIMQKLITIWTLQIWCRIWKQQ